LQHHHWPKIKTIIENSLSYPLEPINNDTRLADIDHMLNRSGAIINLTKHKAKGRLKETKTILRWVIDSRRFHVCLTSEKAKDWVQDIDLMLTHRSCSAKSLESTIGRLNHKSIIAHIGRYFLTCLRYRLCHGQCSGKHHTIQLAKWDVEDLKLWRFIILHLAKTGTSINKSHPQCQLIISAFAHSYRTNWHGSTTKSLVIWITLAQDSSLTLAMAHGHLLVRTMCFAMRLCKYSLMSKQDGIRKTKIVTINNVQFFSTTASGLNKEFPHPTPYHILCKAQFVSITFVNQKDGEKMECITQHRTTHGKIFPVISWAFTVCRILSYKKTTVHSTVNTFLRL
jgi:hypothetical protein